MEPGTTDKALVALALHGDPHLNKSCPECGKAPARTHQPSLPPEECTAYNRNQRRQERRELPAPPPPAPAFPGALLPPPERCCTRKPGKSRWVGPGSARRPLEKLRRLFRLARGNVKPMGVKVRSKRGSPAVSSFPEKGEEVFFLGKVRPQEERRPQRRGAVL